MVIPLTLLCWGFLLPTQHGDTFMGELSHKAALLEQTEGKRIILVGGSSVAFGIDSALLEQHFPEYRVVNFGMYAALGTTVMLDLSENDIREGDIVILMPEQQSQTLSDYFDAAVMWQGMDGAFQLLPRLTQKQLGMMAGQFPYFAARKFTCLLRGYPLQPEGVYRRDSFNAYGDVVHEACARNIMPGGFDHTTAIRFDPELVTEEFLTRVNAYAQSVIAKGATIWYGFCPMNAAAVAGDATADEFYDSLQDALCFPVLGDPNDSILEAGWFYDTNFHLNQSGKIIFTRQLIRNIKAMLLDSSPTQIVLPPMPEWGQAGLWLGDDIHGEYFQMTEVNGTATVTGIKEAGARMKSLTVPSTWNGMQVTSIAAGAFSACTELQTITIQQNIRSIADGAFAGCHSLEQIVVLSDTPATCTVGRRLLQGTDARIYVRSDTFNAFCTDYFWSIHAKHISVLPDS